MSGKKYNNGNGDGKVTLLDWTTAGAAAGVLEKCLSEDPPVNTRGRERPPKIWVDNIWGRVVVNWMAMARDRKKLKLGEERPETDKLEAVIMMIV